MAPQTPNIPPPAKGMTPQQYYSFLSQQGIPGWVAYDAVQANYGGQSDPNKPDAGYQWGQAAGLVGGAIIGREIAQGFPNVREAFTPAKPTTDATIATPRPTGVTRVGAEGAAMAPSAGATPASQATWNAGADAASGGAMVTIDTPAGPQTVPPAIANDSSFLSTVNWNAVANGSVSLLQAYQAYQAYQGGDKLGAGIAATGALTSGAAAASAAGVGGSTTAAIGAAAPYASIAAGLYGGYQTGQMLSDTAAGSQRTKQGAIGGAASGAALGAGIGSIVPGVGTAIGAVIGGVLGGAAGAIGSWTGSSKGKAQFARDQIRGVLQEGGVLNEKFEGTLADGSKYDFGKDGSTLKWKEINKVAANNPNAWSVAVDLGKSLGEAYGWTGQKASDIAAWYGKAAVSNAGDDPNVAIANMRHIAKQQGITYDLIKGKLDEALADERITQDEYNQRLNAASQLTNNLYDEKELNSINQSNASVQTKPGEYKPGQSLETMSQAMGQQMSSNAQITSQQQQPVQLQGWNYYEDLNNRLRSQGR